MNQKKYPAVNIGSATMLVIFITLCLAVFAVLSVASARSDMSYSERIAERTKEYYAACSRAEEMLGQIDEISDRSGTNEEKLAEALEGLKQEGKQGFCVEGLCMEEQEGVFTVSYEVPVNESQKLSVVLQLHTGKTEGAPFYEILQWKEVPAAEWNGDETYDLMRE